MARTACLGKINLSLRITSLLPNGYHELCSLFCKIGPIDYLTINPEKEDNVRVIYNRAQTPIVGENILNKTLRIAREAFSSIPCVDLTLEKNVPPGTGLGAGSGDAAALIRYLSETYTVPAEALASRIGADVPFLASDSQLAIAHGTGAHIQDIERPFSDIVIVVIIPSWRCQTPEMYKKLDQCYMGKWTLNADEAQKEAFDIIKKINDGVSIGLLPNDFTSVLFDERTEYRQLFNEFFRQGAFAWGVSGSGSSSFALWKKQLFNGFDCKLSWIEDRFTFYVNAQDKRGNGYERSAYRTSNPHHI